MTILESNFLVPSGTFFVELLAFLVILVVAVALIVVIVRLATHGSRRRSD